MLFADLIVVLVLTSGVLLYLVQRFLRSLREEAPEVLRDLEVEGDDWRRDLRRPLARLIFFGQYRQRLADRPGPRAWAARLHLAILVQIAVVLWILALAAPH